MMLIGQGRSRTCQCVTRRELLQVGGIGAHGLSLAGWLRAAPRKRGTSRIFVFLEGGPSQLETFDPKPNVPADFSVPVARLFA